MAGTTERVSINSSSEQADGLSTVPRSVPTAASLRSTRRRRILCPAGCMHSMCTCAIGRRARPVAASVPSQLPTGANAFFNVISSDGRFVVFMSQAVGAAQIYEYDRALDATTLVSEDLIGRTERGT